MSTSARAAVPLGDRTNEGKQPWEKIAERVQRRVEARSGKEQGEPRMCGASSGEAVVLVVGGVGGSKRDVKDRDFRGLVAASPNEEARIAREAAEASRKERLRQVRLAVSAAARESSKS